MGMELDQELANELGALQQPESSRGRHHDSNHHHQQQQQHPQQPHHRRHHHHYNQRQPPDQSPRARAEDDDQGSRQGNHMSGQVNSNEQDRKVLRAKVGPHRSQSSPSSLTTHKFGLRPTPSPPRLIIDHQTGDIIESYPEQPVYLRTYQPLDFSEAPSVTHPSEDLSLLVQAAYPLHQSSTPASSLSGKSSVGGGNAGQPGDDGLAPIGSNKSNYLDSIQGASMSQSGSLSSSSLRATSNIIPPPHSAANASRVYFAPPVPSGAAGHHLFPSGAAGREQRRTINHQRQLSDEDDHQMVVSTSGSDQSMYKAAAAATLGQRQSNRQVRDRIQTGSHNSSFKRALNKLDYGNHPQLISSGGKTDIAIVTDEPAYVGNAGGGGAAIAGLSPGCYQASRLAGQQLAAPTATTMNITSTTASVNRSHKRPKLYREEPPIESFNLYNFCFNFSGLLVLLISASIIYLLVKPLNLDCLKYRPTYAYISIIVASVNLTCITVFSLFWFCSGITRALYANLSSSGFIITSYSILVAINLALAITFFFINTCHYQRLARERPTLVEALLVVEGAAEPELRNAPEALVRLVAAAGLEHSARQRRHHDQADDDDNGAKLDAASSPIASYDKESGAGNTGDINNNNNNNSNSSSDNDDHPDQQDDANEDNSRTPDMSPIEAAWEYLKERALVFRRHFVHFLASYDLRFIGTLHALCAVCLQYLAIRIAVVRSYFCSPAGIC